MSVTPIRAARLANARRAVADILSARHCDYPDEAARLIVDQLLNLGWTYPGWHDDDPIPRPATSDDRRRRVLIAQAMAVVESKKRARETVNDEKGRKA